MRKDLYQDLYLLEDTHWWHLSKRKAVIFLLQKYYQKTSSTLTILDIGCGTGKNMEAFSKFGHVYGIDNSSYAIAFCRKRKLKSVRLASAQKLPFHKNTFDVITILDVLEHIDDKTIMKEIARVLKPNGIVIITVPAYQWLWSTWDEILGHQRRYTTTSLQKLLQNEGFSAVRTSYLYSFLLFPAVLIRRFKSRTKNSNYSSDFRINNPIINSSLLFLATIERHIMAYMPIPFGTSVICLAQKNHE
jgi:SAM-dependent methyltransferase